MTSEEKINSYFEKAVLYLSNGKGKLGDGKYFKTQIDVVIIALMFQIDEYFHHDKR